MRSYVTGILFVASVLHLAQTVNGQDTSYYVPMFVWLTARTTWKQEYADIYTEDFRKLEYQMCQKVRQAVHENSIISEAYIGCEFEEFAREGNIWGKMKLEFHKDKYEQSGMTAGFLETYLNDNTDSQYFAGFYNTDKSESISDFAASRLKAAQRTSSTSTVTTEEAPLTTRERTTEPPLTTRERTTELSDADYMAADYDPEPSTIHRTIRVRLSSDRAWTDAYLSPESSEFLRLQSEICGAIKNALESYPHMNPMFRTCSVKGFDEDPFEGNVDVGLDSTKDSLSDRDLAEHVSKTIDGSLVHSVSRGHATYVSVITAFAWIIVFALY